MLAEIQLVMPWAWIALYLMKMLIAYSYLISFFN